MLYVQVRGSNKIAWAVRVTWCCVIFTDIFLLANDCCAEITIIKLWDTMSKTAVSIITDSCLSA
jgi:hypothetical protein